MACVFRHLPIAVNGQTIAAHGPGECWNRQVVPVGDRFCLCIVHGKKARAAAPTGIAASNVEIEGTNVMAQTLHAMLDLDTDLVTKLDFAKVDNKKMKDLVEMEVLLLDEAGI